MKKKKKKKKQKQQKKKKKKEKDIIKNNIKEENRILETNRKSLDKINTIEKNRTIDYKKTLDKLYPGKTIKTDLDFLSEDLPQDKNREKILSINYHQNYSLSNRIDTKNKTKFDFLIEKDIMNELNNVKPSNEESVIKPMNAFKEFEKNINDINNINEIGNSKKENNLKSYFQNKKNKNKGNINEDLIDSFINNNNNFNIKNVVYPINQNKKFLQTETNNNTINGIKKVQNKINDTNFNFNINNYNNNKYNNNNNNTDNTDYFFSLYQDFSNQNKSLHILDNKILKISHRKKELYRTDSPSNSKPNTLLYNMKSISPESKNINMNQYFEKIGLNQDFMSNEKNQNHNLKGPIAKQKYFESLKKDLNLFSYNKNDKQKDNKNSGFKEINEKLEEIKKKKQSNENMIKEKENNNNNNLNNNIENKNKEILKKKEEEIKINKDDINQSNNIKIEENKIKENEINQIKENDKKENEENEKNEIEENENNEKNEIEENKEEENKNVDS